MPVSVHKVRGYRWCLASLVLSGPRGRQQISARGDYRQVQPLAGRRSASGSIHPNLIRAKKAATKIEPQENSLLHSDDDVGADTEQVTAPPQKLKYSPRLADFAQDDQ